MKFLTAKAELKIVWTI